MLTEIFWPGARLETIVFGRVSPAGVASNSLSATEREFVTMTTIDDITFFCGFLCSFFCAFATGAAADGALATGAGGTGVAV